MNSIAMMYPSVYRDNRVFMSCVSWSLTFNIIITDIVNLATCSGNCIAFEAADISSLEGKG